LPFLVGLHEKKGVFFGGAALGATDCLCASATAAAVTACARGQPRRGLFRLVWNPQLEAPSCVVLEEEERRRASLAVVREKFAQPAELARKAGCICKWDCLDGGLISLERPPVRICGVAAAWLAGLWHARDA